MADKPQKSVVTPSILRNIPWRDPKKHTNATVLEMGDWTASSSDLDHEKENVEPAEKKCKSLKLNRNRIDRWDFIGEEHENDLSKK